MILVFDIGNTNITSGVFEGDCLKYTWRMHTKENMTEDEYHVLIDGFLKEQNLSKGLFEAVVISSVVPPLEYIFKKLVTKYFKLTPLTINPKIKTTITINTNDPGEVGADLIVGAEAAFDKFKKALIVIDFGTATTFTAISKDGELMGVSIAPGVLISLEALYSKASKIPKIDIVMPEKAIGRTTTESILSGVIYGAFGQVENIVNKIKTEMNEEDITVVATGGFSKFFEGKLKCIDIIVPDLLLEGLKIIYEKNKAILPV